MAIVLDLRDFLPGSWDLRRTVSGFTRQDKITMDGCAVFQAQGAKLTYQEEGAYNYQGQPLSFQQTYYYQEENDSSYTIYFRDRRPFYSLVLHEKKQPITHLCGFDSYQGLFTWQDDDRWTLCWHVKGPHKDFRIETFYTRLDG